jgi:hypothetical protein
VGEIAIALAVFVASCMVLAAISIPFWLAFIWVVESILDRAERREAERAG